MIDLLKGESGSLYSVFGDVRKLMYFIGQDTQENKVNLRKD